MSSSNIDELNTIKVTSVHGNDNDQTGYKFINVSFITPNGIVSGFFCEAKSMNPFVVNLVAATNTLSNKPCLFNQLLDNTILESLQVIKSADKTYRMKFGLSSTVGAFDIVLICPSIRGINLTLASG